MKKYLHGVGLQGHWSIYEPSASEIVKSLQQFSSLGLKVQITEMDISVHPKENEKREKISTGTAFLTAKMV